MTSRCEIKSKEEWFLMGSAASLEDLRCMMIKKMYWNDVIFKELCKDVWSVANGTIVIEFMRVILKRRRYRLECRRSNEKKN